MQTSPLMQLLLIMENLYVVAAMTLVAIVLRVIWVGYRKRRPLVAPKGKELPPHDGILEAIEVGMFVPAVILWLVINIHPVWRTVIAIGGYFILVHLARLGWKRFRVSHPLPPVSAEHPSSPKDMVLEIIDTVIIALILVFGIVRPLLMQTYFIPSDSMVPTLLGPRITSAGKMVGGDKLIANKFVLRTRMPERGEIIVFNPPPAGFIGNNYALELREWLTQHPKTLTVEESALLLNELQQLDMANNDVNRQIFAGLNQSLQIPPTTDADANVSALMQILPKLPKQRDAFIKRVVGLPNDRISFKPNDGVYLNGQPLEEKYIEADVQAISAVDDPQPAGEMPRLATTEDIGGDGSNADDYFEEFMGWMNRWYKHDEMYLKLIVPHMKNGEFVVPPDSVFVMGDNRGASFDSRWWGIVPRKDIKARAVSTFWPLNRLKLL
ncbi:MAG: signal peptidase I [Armatimonadota bacterium]